MHFYSLSKILLYMEKSRKNKCLAFSTALAAIFTIGILYSTIQLPVIINGLLKEIFVEYGLNIKEEEKFINLIKPFGYISLTIIIALIILGFILKKRKLSFLGSLMIYLPTFSYFASTMFFLAGIGILRILWLPIIELSPGATWFEKLYFAKNILELGSISYLPYEIIRFIASFINFLVDNSELLNIFDFLFFLIIMVLSAIIFFLACASWLYNKFIKQNIVTSGLYKYSRHPQYLSFILWSYALLLYDKYVFHPVKGGYFAPPSLIWLTVIMIVIAIALHEENDMTKTYGINYIRYKNRTPFLFPLPRKVTSIILYPIKKVFKHMPQKDIEIFAALTIYYITLICFSAIYNSLLKMN